MCRAVAAPWLVHTQCQGTRRAERQQPAGLGVGRAWATRDTAGLARDSLGGSPHPAPGATACRVLPPPGSNAQRAFQKHGQQTVRK